MIAARRVVWPEPGKVALEDFEIGPPGERQVQLATLCTLLSPGTERAWLLNLPNTPGRFPSRPGYNHVGRVTAIGAGVESLAVGDIVVWSQDADTRVAHRILSVEASATPPFIITKGEPLKGGPPLYAVLGRVTGGMNVVDKIGRLGDVATELPSKRVVIRHATLHVG